MISERIFSRSYSSFWKDLLPFSEAFVRGVNSRWPKLDEPLHKHEPMERAVVNEAAVRLYRRTASGLSLDMINAIDSIHEAATWLNCAGIQIDEIGVEETLLMAGALQSRFGRSELLFAPMFRGCGILSACAADFIVHDILVEVKSGHRAFRSADFRQILTYLALNTIDERFRIESICLFNPRLWRELQIDVDNLCLQMAGAGAIDILPRIADFLATGIASGL